MRPLSTWQGGLSVSPTIYGSTGLAGLAGARDVCFSGLSEVYLAQEIDLLTQGVFVLLHQLFLLLKNTPSSQQWGSFLRAGRRDSHGELHKLVS